MQERDPKAHKFLGQLYETEGDINKAVGCYKVGRTNRWVGKVQNKAFSPNHGMVCCSLKSKLSSNCLKKKKNDQSLLQTLHFMLLIAVLQILAPPVHMWKCRWARYWTWNCSWWLRLRVGEVLCKCSTCTFLFNSGQIRMGMPSYQGKDTHTVHPVRIYLLCFPTNWI